MSIASILKGREGVDTVIYAVRWHGSGTGPAKDHLKIVAAEKNLGQIRIASI